jgi:MFS family permease
MWHPTLHFNFTHHLHIEKKASLALYITNTIKTFALSLASLYIPIFIYVTFSEQLIFDNNEILNGIYFILAFYFVRSLSTILSMHKIVNFIFGRINFKISIFISNILLGIAMYLLILSESNLIFLFVSSVIFSIETLLYWIPFHTYFVRILRVESGGASTAKFGTSTAIRLFLASIASAGGPILGGLIIKIYGFNVLFLISTILLIISAIPILFGAHEHKHGKHNLSAIIRRYLSAKNYRWNIIAHMAAGIDGNLYAIFAPFLLFIIADKNTSSVGLVISIAVLLASIFTLLAGRILDRSSGKGIQKVSTVINSLFYIPRIFSGTPGILYLVDVFDKINGSFLSVPLMSAAYDQAQTEDNEADYIIYREFFLHLGVLIGIVGFASLLVIFGNWRLIFAVLALVSPFTYLIYSTTKTTEE